MNRHFLLYALAMATVCIACAAEANAQQVPERSVNQILDGLEDSAEDQRHRLDAPLKALQKETEKLQTTLSQKTDDEQAGTNGPVPSKEVPAELENTDDIFERIELLKSIYEKNQAKPTPPAQPTSSPDEPPTKLPHADTNVPVHPPIAQPNIEQMMDFDKKTGQTTVAETAQDDQPELSAERVFPEPVSLFEMGNSLFQTGNISSALETYEAVDRAKITAFDSIWMDFMIANCNRRLGKMERATATYREIANETESRKLTESARRWLKHLESSSKSQVAFERIDEEAKSLIEKAKGHAK